MLQAILDIWESRLAAQTGDTDHFQHDAYCLWQFDIHQYLTLQSMKYCIEVASYIVCEVDLTYW